MFDDITNLTNATDVPIPNGYNGFTWENGYVLNAINYSNPSAGYKNGIVSPPYLAYDAYGAPLTVRSKNEKTFTIHSFYSCSAWYDNITLEITGSRASTTLYTKSVQLFTENKTFIELNWSGVDTVDFNSICFWCCNAKHFTVDNLCVTL